MAYEIFKQILGKDEFLSTKIRFDGTKIKNGNERYKKYIIKAHILNRDNFKCQNDNCPHCHNVEDSTDPELTWHHIVPKDDGGKDTVENGITICLAVHNMYHAAMCGLSLNGKVIPRLDKPDKFFWKIIRTELKIFRKSLSKEEKKPATWEQLCALCKFLDLVEDGKIKC